MIFALFGWLTPWFAFGSDITSPKPPPAPAPPDNAAAQEASAEAARRLKRKRGRQASIMAGAQPGGTGNLGGTPSSPLGPGSGRVVI